MKKLIALALIGALACGLVGCVPKTDGHLTQLLEDLQDPNMEPVYSEEEGHWVAMPIE